MYKERQTCLRHKNGKKKLKRIKETEKTAMQSYKILNVRMQFNNEKETKRRNSNMSARLYTQNFLLYFLPGFFVVFTYTTSSFTGDPLQLQYFTAVSKDYKRIFECIY